MISWTKRAVVGTAFAVATISMAASPAVASDATAAGDNYPTVAGDSYPKVAGDHWPTAAEDTWPKVAEDNWPIIAGDQRPDQGRTVVHSQACKTVTAKETVNIRSAASTRSKVLGALKKGRSGCLMSVVSKGGSYYACGGSSRTWYKIKVAKQLPAGYVAARCMLNQKPPRS
ncbi:SH3 domain-containing protein [Streptomyces abyssalis]|uniref:SH3 domain-containing protein n=1 Tax=Streptomyces abyssalis TaxID=933944 RepID=UPI00085C1BA1|nr:SH3 domain-containing protein [Streptomyces abyssalis]